MRTRIVLSIVFLFSFSSLFSQNHWDKTLLDAIHTQHYNLADTALANGANPNFVNRYSVKRTKSHKKWPAIAILFFPVILLDAVIPPGSDHYEESAFHDLLALHDSSEARYQLTGNMIKKGADVNRPQDYTLPLQLALANNDLRLVKMLVNAGADPYIVSGQYSAFSFSLTMDDTRFTEYFRKQDKMFSSRTTELQVAMDAAFKAGKMDLVFKLHDDFGISPGQYMGQNYFHLIALKQAPGIFNFPYDSTKMWMQQLARWGVDINQKDGYGNTPVMYAAGKDGVYLHYILEMKPDMNLQNNEGKTALHFAVEKDPSAYQLSLMVAYGADISIADKNGKRPGDYLTDTWEYSLTQLMGVPVETRKLNTMQLWELLKNPVLSDSVEKAAVALIESGIFPNQSMPKNTSQSYFDPTTPLGVAVKKHSVVITEALLKAGAIADMKDPNSNHYPLELVFDSRDTAMASLLIRYGADPTAGYILRKVEFYAGYSDCEFWEDICRIRIYFEKILSDERYCRWAKTEDGKYALVNRNNNSILEKPADQYTPFDAWGYSMVRYDSKWGVVRYGGFEVQEARFDTIYALLHTENYSGDVYTYCMVAENGQIKLYRGSNERTYIKPFDEFKLVYHRKNHGDFIVVRTGGRIEIINPNGYYLSMKETYIDVKTESGKLYGLLGDKWKVIKL